ncbi:LysR family transcriptional regulator [Burkholderia perseverans]|uniref:LysR family transcriptional regulator n=1 Tax=Burkholderia perseverans TaxID=2615214 RepID=UPI001FEEE1DA|nr:LysR family transcriptional regulator [Burkholderia perseverans]
MDRFISMGVFAKAVECGSFSAAGDELGMSSQLVGKHVRALEELLGARLLNRTTRRQHLTEIGTIYYDRVKAILADMESAEGLVAETHRIPRGRLKISAPATFGMYALSKSLPVYMARYPELSVELTLSNRYVDLIHEGFDVVLRVGELTDSGLVARPLEPYRLKLCASPSYLNSKPPIKHPNDLQHHECLRFFHPQLSSHWAFNSPEGVISVPVSGRLIVDNGESLMAAARAGMGLLFQPNELVQDDLADGRLVEVLEDFPAPARPFHILFAPDRQMTPKLRTFIDFVLEVFGKPE